MGYFNGVVDWSGPDYAAAAAADMGADRAANQTIAQYAKALEQTKKILEKESMKKVAFRDQNRVFKQRGQITKKDQEEVIQRMHYYSDFIKKYGWKAFKDKVAEQDRIDNTRPTTL